MNNIISKKVFSIILDSGEEIPFNIANWPNDENGNPVSKQLCVWNGSEVVLKSIEMLESENALKELPLTDSKMIRKIDELYNVLITKGILTKEDFSEYFNKDIEERKVLREKV